MLPTKWQVVGVGLGHHTQHLQQTKCISVYLHIYISTYLHICAQHPTLYSAIPITANCVYLLASMFALAGVLLRTRPLLGPWLGLYCLKIMFAAALLVSTLQTLYNVYNTTLHIAQVYTTFLLPKVWFRVLLVLVVAPVLVLEAALWTLILKFYLRSQSAISYFFFPNNSCFLFPMSSFFLFRLKSVHKKSAAATAAAPHTSGPGPRAELGAELGAGLSRQVSSSGSDDISTGTVSGRGEIILL